MRSMFTVVITTRNRPTLLERAVRSVWTSHQTRPEVIVVDDASDIELGRALSDLDPRILYLRNPIRRGPGPGRNLGIERAQTPLVVILDDDDALVPDALSLVELRMKDLPGADAYPCIQFARENGRLDRDFGVVGLEDFVTGRIGGDFTPVIQRQEFLKQRLGYPDTVVGGEGLLWFEIARRHGIPTWRTVVTLLGTEAPTRLCSVDSQLARPREYAAVQEQCLREFGADLLAISKPYYMKRHIGAAAYWLLAGDRGAARKHIRSASGVRMTPGVFCAWVASWLPRPLVRMLFRCYRLGTL